MNDGIPSEVICEAEDYALRELRLPPDQWVEGHGSGLSIPFNTNYAQILDLLKAAFIAGRLRNLTNSAREVKE